MAQTSELPGEGGGRASGEQRQEVGAAESGDVEAGALQGGEQGVFGTTEKVAASELAAVDGTGLGETRKLADAGRKIVETGEVFEIAAIAAEQDLSEVLEAVDGLFDGGEGAGYRALPMFHLAVVLESGDVVGGGLDAQDESEFVVDLDRGFAETMLDAGALDPGCKLTSDLLGELGSDLVAEEGGDVFGFDGQDGLSGKLLIEGLEDGWRAEHQIRGVLDLNETPMVGLSEDVEDRTALLGITIEDAMEVIGREAVGEGLRPGPVVDAQEDIVGKGEADPGGGELPGQPAMAIAVEVVVQASAAIRPQEGAVRLLVVPGLVAVAGFHRRDDMDEAGMLAADGEHFGDDVFLADVALGNVLDGNAGSTRQFSGALAHAIAKRFGKSRIVEDPDLPCRKKCCHPVRVAGAGQGTGDNDPVVARKHAGEALAVTLGEQLRQLPLPHPTSAASILSCLVPAWPG